MYSGLIWALVDNCFFSAIPEFVKAMRLEKDLLGEREIPLDAYWGVHTLRAVENFPIMWSANWSLPLFGKKPLLGQTKSLAMTKPP